VRRDEFLADMPSTIGNTPLAQWLRHQEPELWEQFLQYASCWGWDDVNLRDWMARYYEDVLKKAMYAT